MLSLGRRTYASKQRFNASDAFFYLLLFVCPFGSFMGLDPIWGGEYSAFVMSRMIDFWHLIVMIIIIFGYLKFKKGNKEIYLWKQRPS